MSELQTITTFLGWCAILNISLLLFSTVWPIGFRDFTKSIHSAIMGVDQDTLDSSYFQYLGNFKLALIVFNIVPYFALKIMA